MANIALGLDSCLYMGNIDALRDWGHAKDYVQMQWLMLQQDNPDDFVIASGKQHSVRDFINWSAKSLGITLKYSGKGINEIGTVSSVEGDKAPKVKVGQVIIRIDKRYFRPSEVENLLGDPSKAKDKLGWKPQITPQEMCKEMIEEDYRIAKRHLFLKENGLELPFPIEDQ